MKKKKVKPVIPQAEEIKVKFTEKEKETQKVFKCSEVKVISKKRTAQQKDDESEELPEED